MSLKNICTCSLVFFRSTLILVRESAFIVRFMCQNVAGIDVEIVRRPGIEVAMEAVPSAARSAAANSRSDDQGNR